MTGSAETVVGAGAAAGAPAAAGVRASESARVDAFVAGFIAESKAILATVEAVERDAAAKRVHAFVLAYYDRADETAEEMEADPDTGLVCWGDVARLYGDWLAANCGPRAACAKEIGRELYEGLDIVAVQLQGYRCDCRAVDCRKGCDTNLELNFADTLQFYMDTRDKTTTNSDEDSESESDRDSDDCPRDCVCRDEDWGSDNNEDEEDAAPGKRARSE